METRAKILTEIRDRGPVGQVTIADSLGADRSTVSRAVAALIGDGLVRPCGEMPASRSGGRKTVLLEINPDGASALGVALNIRTTQVAHVNLAGEILWKREYRTPEEGTPETILPFLQDTIETALQESGAAGEHFMGIGVGAPGHIDARRGVALSAVNFDKSWKNVEMASLLREWFPFPVTVDSDGRMLVLAEQWYGEGRGIDDFCIFHVGYGLGMAAVIQRKYFRGANGHACDIHMAVDPDGPVCRCGRKGCIEAIVGHELLENNPNPEQVSHAARMLGITIANLIDVFDPARVILTGRVLDQCPGFINSVDSAYHDYAIDTRSTPEPNLVKSHFGEDGHTIGAALARIQQQLGMEE